MASIPTFVHFGAEQLNGGAVGSRADTAIGFPAGLWGVYRHNQKLSKVIPSGPDGITGGTYLPYWDGQYPSGGAGAFVAFHYQDGIYIAGAKGDRWYEFGGGITPTALLMHHLGERYPTAPGFKMIKAAEAGGFDVGNAFKDGGAGYAAVLSEYNQAVATMGADTPDVKFVVIDVCDRDLLGFASDPLTFVNYKTNVASFVTAVRRDIQANVPVMLVSPHPGMLGVSVVGAGGDTGAYLLRELNRQLAAEIANFVVFDMGWATDFVPLALNVGADDPDWRYYASETYLQAGARMGRLIDAYYTEAPVAAVGQGVPVVALICDSQGVGSTDPQFAVLTDQESILGPLGGTVRAGQWIWNAQTRAVELYDVLLNTNTFGTTSANIGPEGTLLKRLHERFPDGVVVFKYALNGVALTVEAEAAGAVGALEEPGGAIFAEIESDWADCRAAVLRDLNRSPDLVGICVSIGGNDQINDTTATAFAEKIGTYVDDIRDALTTRSTGAATAFAILQTPPHVDAGGNSVHNIASATAIGRSATASLATSKTRVAVLLNAGDETYELRRTDHIHIGGEGVFQVGYDFADAIVGLIDDEEGETSAATSSVSGSAAFTVEDGSGLSSANSYASVAEFHAYWDAMGNPAVCADASQAEVQDALRRATEYLDDIYGAMWKGSQATVAQRLNWPRASVYDESGVIYGNTTIPRKLSESAIGIAKRVLDGDTLDPDVEPDDRDIASSSVTVGPISVSDSFSGTKATRPEFASVTRKLRGLLIGGGSRAMAGLTR